MKLQDTTINLRPLIVSDFDDVVCNTTSQWFQYSGIPNYKDIWHRKHWHMIKDPCFGHLPFISGDCYDKMDINELGEFLIKKAEDNEITLFIVSSAYKDTDASKQRMFNRVFPKCVSCHIVPYGESKGTYIKEKLKINSLSMFIDDKLQNHRDVLQAGIRCETLAAPLTPFTVDHELMSSTYQPIKHYIPTDFHTSNFKLLF